MLAGIYRGSTYGTAQKLKRLSAYMMDIIIMIFSRLIFKFTLCSIFDSRGRGHFGVSAKREMAARRRAFGWPVRLGISVCGKSSKCYALGRRHSTFALSGAGAT